MGLQTPFASPEEKFSSSVTVSPAIIKAYNNLYQFRHPSSPSASLDEILYLKGGDEGNDSPLPSFKELLGGAGGTQHTISSVECGRGRADSAEHPIFIDCDKAHAHAPTLGTNGGGDRRGETDSRSSGGPRSGGLPSKGQDGEQSSISTPPISPTLGPCSETRTPTLREKTNHPTSSPPPPSPPPPPLLSPLSPPLLTTPSPPPLPPSPPSPPSIVLSSTFDTQAELIDSALKDIEPGPSGGGKEKTNIYNEHKEDGREGDRTAKGATGVIGIQDSFERTADSAGMNEGRRG